MPLRIVGCLFAVMIASAALAQTPSEAIIVEMRATATQRDIRSQLPASLPNAAAVRSWQAITPQALKHSSHPFSVADLKLEPRLATADRGYVERHRPATEQLLLGLSADPPRPEFPEFNTGPRSSGPARSSHEIVQLPPLQKSSDARPMLSGDPASVAARPYTAAFVVAQRGVAPFRSNIGIIDPFVIQKEVQLRQISADSDPPAVSFGVPERAMLPMENVAK